MNRGDYYVYDGDGLTYRVSHTALSLMPPYKDWEPLPYEIVVLYRPGTPGEFIYCALSGFEENFKRVTDTTTILDLVDLEDRAIDKR